MQKRILALLMSAVLLLCLAACKKDEPQTPGETTPAATEPVADATEHFDLNEIDLAGIGELFAQRDDTARYNVRLDGLCTPVVLELWGTELVSITAYGITALVDTGADDYNSIYGHMSPVIYEHEGLIILNIWDGNIGYSCVMCPDGTYMEAFPDDEYSVMIYEDEEGNLCQSQFAMKFAGIEQWETGPIDMTISRDEFYYSVDDAKWTKEEYSVISRETYTISDCFALDEIFDRAKANGLYPDFDTLDELLEYNAIQKNEHLEDGSDPSRDEVLYFDELRAAYDYDGEKNLLNETYYTVMDNEFFSKFHDYDENNREISGTWIYQGEEAYRYINSYDQKGNLTETIWYQGDAEVERFTYTYNSKGGHTETFFQNGEKKYNYTFDGIGELTAHSIFDNGKEIKTKDVKSLVKTQLLTDIWFPFMDNGTLHFDYRYNGTVPMDAPKEAKATTAADGSYILTCESIDEEDGEHYQQEYHYNADDQLLKFTHSAEGSEYLRDEYQYDSEGRRIQQTTYLDGKRDTVSTFEYNSDGLLSRLERTYSEEQIDYILTTENGKEVTNEYKYTVRTETYRYNAKGLLTETVYYADGQEIDRDTYKYDANDYVLPSNDTYQYEYNSEGVLEKVWLIYKDCSSGAAQLRSRTVYVTPENARQLREILHHELSWF